MSKHLGISVLISVIAGTAVVQAGISPSDALAGGFADRIIHEKVEEQWDVSHRLFSAFSPASWFSEGTQNTLGQAPPTPIEGLFDQRIDPFHSSDHRTFKQRYFLNSAYASGPNA